MIMLALLLLALGANPEVDIPPVPGGCAAPVPADRDTPGCYKTGEMALQDVADTIYWHIYAFPTEAAAIVEARKHRHATTTQMHGQAWLYVLDSPSAVISEGVKKAVIGPLRVPSVDPIAHFAAAIFPPGMRTRIHAHPGPEAFYVVDGEQCMETPTEKQLLRRGETYVVKSGAHLQAAPKGRRNLVLILAPKAMPTITLRSDWKPTGFCDR